MRGSFLWRNRVLLTSGVLLVLSLHLISTGVRPGDLAAAPQSAILEIISPIDAAFTRLGDGASSIVNDYLALPNYVRNLRRLGFTSDDLQGPASDRLVDAVVAQGDEEAVAARVRAHHDAGADHVCIYVVGGKDEALALDAWRRLAPLLTGR